MRRDRNKNRSLSELQELQQRLEQAEATIRELRAGREQTRPPAPPATETPGAAKLPDAFKDAASVFDALVEGIRDGAAILSCDQTIITCNQRFAGMLRLERDQVIGRPILPFVLSDDHPPLHALLKSCPDTFERLHVHLTGWNKRPLPTEVVVRTLPVNGTRVMSLLATDLRKYRRAQEQFKFQAFILDNISDAVIAADEQNRITYWNPAAERMYGFTAGEVLGRHVNQVIRSEATPEQRAEFIQQMHEHGRLETEIVHYDRHGKRLWIRGLNTALRTADGRIIGYVGVSHDITEQRRDEEQMREQAALLDLTQDAIFVRDPQSRITFWNHGAEAMYGWTKAEAVGQFIQDLLQTEFTKPLAEIEREVEQEGRWEGELVHSTRAGKTIPVHSRWSLLRDTRDRPIAILQINTDITERKRMEGELRQLNADLERRVAERTAELINEIGTHKQTEYALRESEERYRTLLENALDAIVVTDPSGSGKVLSANAAACRLFGYTEEEIVQLDQNALLDTNDPNVLTFTRQRENAERTTAELLYKRKDGTRFTGELTTAYFQDRNGERRAVAIIRDITERKRAEDQVAALNRNLERRAVQLETANKELESFSYSVSHDLRTPLASINSFSSLLNEDYAAQLPPEGQRYLDFIQAHAQQMSELVESLLTFSRLTRQPVQKQQVDMIAVLKDALEMLQSETQRPNLTIVIGELPEAQADPVLVRQVWMNLIGNSLKFTRKSERARIEIGCGQFEDEDCVYYVRDNGVGFDQEQSERLFGVFQRLHGEDEYEGTGIGLATVQRIIHRHGGRVWAEGVEGKGATFYFTLA